MSKRFVVVGGATAVAGLVLGASILFGPDATKPSKTQVNTNIQAPDVKTPAGQGDTGATGSGIDIVQFKEGDDGQVTRIRIRAKRFGYKPLGVTDMTQPRADIALGTQRAISITADQADIIMENNKARAGTFSGNVIVTLYEAPAGTRLVTEPSDPAHTQFIQQRIYLDDKTDFSIEEDAIKTNGPVHATSPQVDFFGIGLDLAYNTLQKRIERLEITQGRYLMYNPDAPTNALADATSDTANADAEQREASGTNEQKPAAPNQFYAATFAGNVVVREGLETELGGDQLTIDFSMGGDVASADAFAPPTESSRGPLPSFLLASQTQFAQAGVDNTAPLPIVTIPDKNKQRSLFNHAPERDIVVTWTGTMRVTPHDTKPDALADEDDVRVTLIGENAYAQTTRNGELERLETSRLEYRHSIERTTAFAKTNGPVRVLSNALGGELTGQRITLRQQEATATVQGPGLLNYTDPKDGKTLKLHWKNRLDLDLYTQATSSNNPHADAKQSEASGTRTKNNTRTNTRILGVKTATFDTAVTATHPDFDLAANKLSLTFQKPDEARDIDNTPTAINAVGDVEVFARGDAEDERFTINAQRLSIDLTTAQGETYASAIRAVESVDVRQPGSTLTCDRVDVELMPPTAKQANATNADAEQREASGTPNPNDRFAEVRSIFSVGNVRANLNHDGRRVSLIADSLFAEVDKDKLTLASNRTKQLAEVFDLDKQQKITGQVIVMDDQAKALDITGPGSLATAIADPNAPQASIEDAFLAISWSDRLSFDDAAGKAEFFGNVRSESRRSTDASEMTCDQLVMLLSPDEKGKDREVRSAVATGDVAFSASAWEDPANPSDFSNRTLLKGPKMVFTNLPAAGRGQPPIETLFVDGAGQMLIQDFRTPDADDKDDSVFVTGRGSTVFSWQDNMLLNAFTNTATLSQRVQMVHQPVNDQGKVSDVVTLNGQKLVADLIDTGGLSVWLSDDAPSAQISVITVDGGVRLKNANRAMTGDHLKYVAEDHRINVWSNAGKNVILEDLQRGNETLTNRVIWDLTKDRIEIEELRGGAAPLN